MERPPDAVVREVLRRFGGGRAPELLGAGMEGAVYALDDARVAKVWFATPPARLRTLQRFQAALAGRPLGFVTPRVDEVATVKGWAVTVERRLTGTGLDRALAAGTLDLASARAACVRVLTGLAAAGPLPAARELAVLDGMTPLYGDDGTDFPAALAGLVARRARGAHDVLAAAVPDVDRWVDALAARLPEVDSGRRAVVHGDLFPGNVLVTADGRPEAVLDWGFLTTEGDPVFDAAVAAAIFDMYGERARENEDAMRELVHGELAGDRTAMLVYRAAYSLLTATAYSADGSDGHFAWCVEALRRPEVARAVLG